MNSKNSIKFCDLLGQMIKEANLSNVKFYTSLGIKKPYFYDILSGKVNPPPPDRQFAMIKLLNPKPEQIELLCVYFRGFTIGNASLSNCGN